MLLKTSKVFHPTLTVHTDDPHGKTKTKHQPSHGWNQVYVASRKTRKHSTENRKGILCRCWNIIAMLCRKELSWVKLHHPIEITSSAAFTRWSENTHSTFHVLGCRHIHKSEKLHFPARLDGVRLLWQTRVEELGFGRCVSLRAEQLWKRIYNGAKPTNRITIKEEKRKKKKINGQMRRVERIKSKAHWWLNIATSCFFVDSSWPPRLVSRSPSSYFAILMATAIAAFVCTSSGRHRASRLSWWGFNSFSLFGEYLEHRRM